MKKGVSEIGKEEQVKEDAYTIVEEGESLEHLTQYK
jgi:hypothetical protein